MNLNAITNLNAKRIKKERGSQENYRLVYDHQRAVEEDPKQGGLTGMLENFFKTPFDFEKLGE